MILRSIFAILIIIFGTASSAAVLRSEKDFKADYGKFAENLRLCKVKNTYSENPKEKVEKACPNLSYRDPLTDIRSINTALIEDPELDRNQLMDASLIYMAGMSLNDQALRTKVAQSSFRRRNKLPSARYHFCLGSPEKFSEAKNLKDQTCALEAESFKDGRHPSDYETIFAVAEDNAMLGELVLAKLRDEQDNKDDKNSPLQIDPIVDPKVQKLLLVQREYQKAANTYLDLIGEHAIYSDSPVVQKRVAAMKSGRYLSFSKAETDQLNRHVDEKFDVQIKSLEERAKNMMTANDLLSKAAKKGGVSPSLLHARAAAIKELEYMIGIDPRMVARHLADLRLSSQDLCSFINRWIPEENDRLINTLISALDSTATTATGAALIGAFMGPVAAPAAGALGTLATATGFSSLGLRYLRNVQAGEKDREFQLAYSLGMPEGETAFFEPNSRQKELAIDVAKDVALLKAHKVIQNTETMVSTLTELKSEKKVEEAEPMIKDSDSQLHEFLTPAQVQAAKLQWTWARKQRENGQSREEVADDLWQRISDIRK